MTSDKAAAIQRYTPGFIDDGESRYLGMREYTDGGYVKYTDHAAALQVALDSRRAELVSKIQSAISSLEVPKMTPARAEYYKAGCRAAIVSIQLALAPAKKVD